MAGQSTIAVYALDGSNRRFTVPFEYLARRFVTVTLLGTNREPLALNTNYRFITANTIETNITHGSGDGYVSIEIRRETSATERMVDFADGSVLRSRDLNISAIQTIHVAEEARNLAGETLAQNQDGDLDARFRKLVNLGEATGPLDAVPLGQVQAWSGSALNQADRALAEANRSEAQATLATNRAAAALASQNAAKLSETNSKTSETNSKTNENASVAAKTASETARNVTTAARDTILAIELTAAASDTSARAARDASITARNAAQLAETNSTANRIAAGNSQTAAKTSETNSKTSETNANTHRANTVIARDATYVARDQILAIELTSAASASAALASKNAAKTSETKSKSSENKALQYRNEASNFVGTEYARKDSLGTAATKNVGTVTGAVMEVGAFGVGNVSNDSPVTILGSANFWYSQTLSTQYPFGIAVQCPAITRSVPTLNFSAVGDVRVLIYDRLTGTTSNVKVIYHTGNTTKGPDGTLKASSPTINLFTDSIQVHNADEVGGVPMFERVSKGVYTIKGTLGLRSEGWFLETPSDRNGNKYFNVEWEQNITPDADEGVVVKYRDDVVITIRTFERVWDKDTGVFTNGTPVDINDNQVRFIQLRLNEIEVLEEI